MMRVRSGRTLTNFHPTRDVMSVRCRFRHGYRTAALPLSDRDDVNPEVPDALRDEGAEVDQAGFRMDFEAWLATLEGRPRAVAEQLAGGLNTVEVARIHDVTGAMIYLVRKKLAETWEEREKTAPD